MVLKLVYIAILLIWCIYPLESAWYLNLNENQNQNQTIARPGCSSKCGNVSILFPFGMHSPKCYASKPFEIECRHNNNTSQGDQKPVPYLKNINVEVMYIDVQDGTVGIKNPIFHPGKNCERTGTGINLEGSPFVYSHNYNSLVAVGCQNAALMTSDNTILTDCVSVCFDDLKNGKDIDIASCRGSYCCETSLPPYLSKYNISVETVDVKGDIQPECGYVLIRADYSAFKYVYDEYNSSYWVPTLRDLKSANDVPAVLEWEIPINTPNNSFPEFRTDLYGSYNCSSTNVTSSQYSHSGWRCSCTDGFQGNPYIHGGCIQISWGEKIRGAKWTMIALASCLATTILLLCLRWLHKAVRKKITTKHKEKFFRELLLEQRLSNGEVNVDKVKLFSLKDLSKATDHFNINRVVGKGGQGTVYKGMLVDGKIVAVKKFKVNGKVEEFINEFVILSQINHRNVVQLLGCCLETEIPLLVYEFIPNGNLYEHLHGQNEELPMTWDMRLRIATEVAGALFYLHSFASQPIYHRDIKSTNILLDGKYKAKVADFGASRMVSIEATHLTTAVQGTFGYLDPEYFYTNQLTEKSDVYSFGVVLVELLTGQKPISTVREPELKSLASHFLLCMEENCLFDIIDERVMQEGEKEHIIVVANLVRRCLESNGRKRPTMKEVTLELESIQKSNKQSNAQEHHAELELAGIEDNQFRVAYSTTSSSGQTSDSKESTMEIMPILIK